MILSCDPNQVISILKANFGRESHDVCIIDKNITVTCQSSSALQIMQTYCDNKESCSAMASSSVFGNECSGVTRYLSVFFVCAEAGMLRYEQCLKIPFKKW
jgi:hypothetical protein